MRNIIFAGVCLALLGLAFGLARFVLAQTSDEERVASLLYHMEDGGAVIDLSELCGRELEADLTDEEIARIEAKLRAELREIAAAAGGRSLAEEDLNDPTLSFIPIQTTDFVWGPFQSCKTHFEN